MVQVTCYNCESADSELYLSENGFQLVRCVTCGLLYVTPRPDDRDITDATKTGEHRGENTLEVTGRFRKDKISQYLSVLQDFFPAPPGLTATSWLDIGCGHGEFIMALREFAGNNIFVTGFEPNERKRESAKQKGLHVEYFDLDKHTETYEYISLLNVLSHIPDPKRSFNSWKRLLRPGGELFLETGDITNISSREIHRPLDLPDHLSFVSESILVHMLEDIGFEIIDIKKYNPFFFNKMQFLKGFVKLFVPGKISRLRPRYLPPRYRIDMYIRARLKN
jgi:SAM-dependent methyltransferase